MKTATLRRIAVALVISGFAGMAGAQYIWLDEKGVKQYSDMAPPISVPQNRILKQPGMPSHSPSQETGSAAPDKDNNTASAVPAKAKAPMSAAEKNADFQRRKIEQAEKDKKSSEEAKLKADNEKNCERTREYQRSLESGERITHTDKGGERSYLSDEQRMQEMKESKRVLEGCK